MAEEGYKVPGYPEGVDPRLDNRQGTDRPVLEKGPAVPQQVDGPDLMHQAEHARAVAEKAKAADKIKRKGMFSPGDHSLGDESERGGNDAGQADDVLETDPGNPASASTDAAKADPAAGVVAPSAEQAAKIAENAEQARSTARATETATAAPGERRARGKAGSDG